MKCKIVIETIDAHSNIRKSEVWSGELEILEDTEYLTKISIIGEGQPHPICDVPFALNTGYWHWVKGDIDTNHETFMG